MFRWSLLPRSGQKPFPERSISEVINSVSTFICVKNWDFWLCVCVRVRVRVRAGARARVGARAGAGARASVGVGVRVGVRVRV